MPRKVIIVLTSMLNGLEMHPSMNDADVPLQSQDKIRLEENPVFSLQMMFSEFHYSILTCV
jgi:hypothetical protein